MVGTVSSIKLKHSKQHYNQTPPGLHRLEFSSERDFISHDNSPNSGQIIGQPSPRAYIYIYVHTYIYTQFFSLHQSCDNEPLHTHTQGKEKGNAGKPA